MAKYYEIDEKMARAAHEANSMRDYRPNQKTDEYRLMVDGAAATAAEQIALRPEFADEINDILDRYSRKLAGWFNEMSRVDAMCPSILVSGGSNFPVKKKEKQNARRDAMWKKWEEIKWMLHRMKTIGTGGIKASDEKAVYKLQVALDAARELQEHMKAVNAYYRKHKTLDGCEIVTDDERRSIEDFFARYPGIRNLKPYETYEFTNNNAKIHRLEDRIKEIQAIKDAGSSETEAAEYEGLKVVENTEAMRIQLIFDGKPDPEVRDILKSNGFRWAPSQGAWQRQLNRNGKSAAETVLRQLAAL